MNTIILTIGIVLLVLGIIGLFANWYVAWMWVLAAVGLIGIVWGWVANDNRAMKLS